MDIKSILTKSLSIQEKHYKKLKNITAILDKENTLYSVLVRELSSEINEIQELMLDILEVPTTKYNEKYNRIDQYRILQSSPEALMQSKQTVQSIIIKLLQYTHPSYLLIKRSKST